MVGIGLLFAYSALAQPNNREITTFYKSEFLPYEAIYNIYYPDTGEFVPIEVKPKVVKAVSTVGQFYNGLPLECFCAEWLKRTYGFNVGKIEIARNWPQNIDHPVVGGVVILNWSPLGHVGEIIKITDTGFYIDNVNKVHCQRTTDFIKFNDPNIISYWKP